MKLDRMLYILLKLLNNGQVTAGELAEHFQVSVRTIYRDMELLSLAGIPVYARQGSAGGFSILDSYKLDKHLLKEEEISSVIRALKGMATIVDDAGVDSTIEKLKALLQKTEKEPAIDISIDYSTWGNIKKQKEKLKILSKAIKEQQVLELNYTNSNSESSLRQVEPVKLVYKSNSWYLQAYCRVKQADRVFRVSRIIAVKALKEHFQPRERQEQLIPELWLAELSSHTPNIEFTLRFRPSCKARVYDNFDPARIELLEDGSMQVKLTNPDNQWTYGFILSFGPEVEVIEPAYLRGIIKEQSKKIFELYQ